MDNKTVPNYIFSDLTRYYGKSGWGMLIRKFLRDSVIRWHCGFRMSKGKGLVKLMGLAILFVNGNRRRIQIPRSTEIGYGLYISHGGPVIVNGTCKIGDNCNLSQFTTIGSNEEHAATIGNNVYIGPGVCVVEDVRIGNNVTIGAGSVVVKDIPDNATAVGNYAKVINYNNPGRYVQNPWH